MKTAWLTALVLLTPACLENDEELDVHPDGSVEVTLSARGDLGDLAEGYPIPLGAPWRPASEDTHRWLQSIGPATGGPGVRARAAGVAWPGAKPGHEPQARLAVQGHFASVEELPRSYAPADEDYAGTFLARDTRLAIEERPAGRTYVFERTVHGFDRARLDPVRQKDLPDELQERLEAHALSAEERARVIEIVTSGHARAAEALARDALLGLFLEGDGELPAHEVPALVDEVRGASAAVVTSERLGELLVLVETRDDAAGKELETLEHDWRAALRGALERGLARREVPTPVRNAVAYALEWQLAAFDHYEDLGDESFRLRVRLPGTLVGGNFERTEDGAAVFELDGKALQQGDVVLRAVSVLE